MKQRHSYTDLMYHLVFRTKEREPLIATKDHIDALLGCMKIKANQLDAQILEFGGYFEHVHLLLRARPTVALSALYGQLKGFSSHSWHREYSDLAFGWADGVWAKTVDPDNCEALRVYVRDQWSRHEQRESVAEWEPE